MGWIFYLVSICILPFVQLWLVQASIPLPWNMEGGELWMDHIMNTKLRWFSAVTLVTMDLVLLLLNAFLMGLGAGELKDRTAKVCLACFRCSFWGVNFLNYFFFKTQPLQWLEWLIFFCLYECSFETCCPAYLQNPELSSTWTASVNHQN